MAQNNFQAFLIKGVPFGDSVYLPFVDHAMTDPNFPDPKSWNELEEHIKRANPDAPTDTINAAKHVWQLYVKAH